MTISTLIGLTALTLALISMVINVSCWVGLRREKRARAEQRGDNE